MARPVPVVERAYEALCKEQPAQHLLRALKVDQFEALCKVAEERKEVHVIKVEENEHLTSARLARLLRACESPALNGVTFESNGPAPEFCAEVARILRSRPSLGFISLSVVVSPSGSLDFLDAFGETRRLMAITVTELNPSRTRLTLETDGPVSTNRVLLSTTDSFLDTCVLDRVLSSCPGVAALCCCNISFGERALARLKAHTVLMHLNIYAHPMDFSTGVEIARVVSDCRSIKMVRYTGPYTEDIVRAFAQTIRTSDTLRDFSMGCTIVTKHAMLLAEAIKRSKSLKVIGVYVDEKGWLNGACAPFRDAFAEREFTTLMAVLPERVKPVFLTRPAALVKSFLFSRESQLPRCSRHASVSRVLSLVKARRAPRLLSEPAPRTFAWGAFPRAQ